MDVNNEALIQAKASAYNQNSWFLPDFIEKAIEQIAHQFLTKEALIEWTAAYPQMADKMTHKKVGIVMAGNIPFVGFHDLLSTLIAGHTAVAKLSSKDTVGMEYMINTLIEIEPQWKEHIIVQSHLKDCDAYIATGSNNTSRYFEQYFGKYPHIIRSIFIFFVFMWRCLVADVVFDFWLVYSDYCCRSVRDYGFRNDYCFSPCKKSFDPCSLCIYWYDYRSGNVSVGIGQFT